MTPTVLTIVTMFQETMAQKRLRGAVRLGQVFLTCTQDSPEFQFLFPPWSIFVYGTFLSKVQARREASRDDLVNFHLYDGMVFKIWKLPESAVHSSSERRRCRSMRASTPRLMHVNCQIPGPAVYPCSRSSSVFASCQIRLETMRTTLLPCSSIVSKETAA